MGVHAPLNILITFSILFHCKSDYISTLWTVNDVTGKDGPWKPWGLYSFCGRITPGKTPQKL